MTILQIGGQNLPKEPSELSFGMYDISDDEAGRINDASKTMYKQRVGEIHKISIGWQNLTPTEEAAILQMFKPEYLMVTYSDPYTGNNITREFYRGDIDTALRSWTVNKKRYSKLSFNLEERRVHTN